MSNSNQSTYISGFTSNTITARILPLQQEVITNEKVKLDGRGSSDSVVGELTYNWSFIQTPIGSTVRDFGFVNLEEDGSVVSFNPDISGTYIIGLSVSNDSITSEITDSIIDVRLIPVPYHKNLIPDASFIWSYLSNFWNDTEGKNKIETLWSSMIQIVASELLALYQYDYGKSIKTIQDVLQKRWISLSPAIDIDPELTTFVLSEEVAGSHLSSYLLDLDFLCEKESGKEFTANILIPKEEASLLLTYFGKSYYKNKLLNIENRSHIVSDISEIKKSINNGLDGEIVSGNSFFYGSSFTSGMIGNTIKYKIDNKIYEAEITAFSHSGKITLDVSNWTTSLPDIEYSVIPNETNYYLVVTSQENIRSNIKEQSWRFGSLLTYQGTDFEELGVSAGDALEMRVTRTDLNIPSYVYGQVTGVLKDKVSFIFDYNPYSNGVALPKIPDETVILLSADLRIEGLLQDLDGSLLYQEVAEEVLDTVSQGWWKGQYFEKRLTTSDELEVGPFKVSITPTKVIRTKKILVSDDTLSIPVLQEFIKQPVIINEQVTGAKFLLDGNGSLNEISRDPIILSENLDYVIDNEETIKVHSNVTSGNELVNIPNGDLIYRSVNKDDTIYVKAGSITQTFSIVRIVDQENILVYPTPDFNSLQSETFINRRIKGKFVRFTEDIFSSSNLPPERLWAEVLYRDNNKQIEDNFGSLIGINIKDIERDNTNISYSSIVEGLVYAITNNSSFTDMELATQILFGLPFSQDRGIIKEINPDFRKNPDGSPLYGRLVIDAVDDNDNRLGVTFIYLYPQGPQEIDPGDLTKWIPQFPEWSGLAINESTGVTYTVGDTVEKFSILSKGVEARDYLQNPKWVTNLVGQGSSEFSVQKYHLLEVFVNNNLIQGINLDKAAEFLNKAKLHYIKFAIGIQKLLEDRLNLTERFYIRRKLHSFDNLGLSLPTALKLDNNDINYSYLDVDRGMLEFITTGTDLATTYGSAVVSSSLSKFLTPTNGKEAPTVRPKYILRILRGSNSGDYTIGSVPSNTTLNCGFTTFETSTLQEFEIYRRVQNPIWTGNISVTNGLDTFVISDAVSARVAAGDTLVFVDTSSGTTPSKRYEIDSLYAPNSSPKYIKLRTAIAEATGTYAAAIIRKGLLLKSTFGPEYGTPIVLVDSIVGDQNLILTGTTGQTDYLYAGIIERGDILKLNSITYTVVDTVPASKKIMIYPPAVSSLSASAITIEKNYPEINMGVDLVKSIPAEKCSITLKQNTITANNGLVTTSGSRNVHIGDYFNFASGDILPSDYIVILDGPDSLINIGYGIGVFPISHFITDTVISLIRPLTNTSPPGVSYKFGIRRVR